MKEDLAWILCQGLTVLVLAFLLSICLRRKTSEFQRRFWCGVWLALALLPLATLALPKWSVRQPVVREVAAPPVVSVAPLSVVSAEALSFRTPPERVTPKRSLSEILGQAWLVVACLLLFRLIVSQILLYRLNRNACEAPQSWKESLPKTCPAALRMSPRVRVPMTWGLVRPVIMIPESYKNHSEAERAFVLQHECQHLLQNDTRWLALAQVVLCLHWVNPFAWLAMKRLRLAQEKSCDEAVVRADNAAVSYADFLLQAAKHTSRSLFRPLALAVVPSRQNALKQRLTNILTPTMKTKPSKRFSASLVLLVTAVCLILATLGWRTPSIAHDVSDPDLQQKLESKVLESVELKSANVKGAIDYLKAPLLELDVNIVLLRGAQLAQESDHTQRAMLDHMIAEQEKVAEEARLRMLDLMERYRIVSTGLEIASLRLKQSEENMLAKQIAIATEKMRIERSSDLDGNALIRFIGDELPSNPFLESAVNEYIRAKAELTGLFASGVTKMSDKVAPAEGLVKHHEQKLAEEVKALRSLLRTKLDMAEHEISLARDLREHEQDKLMDERRKMAEYEPARRDYDRQLAALADLEQRQLDARLRSAQSDAPRIDLDLTNVTLADAMTYALQLAGLDYRLRKNTVVIGTPAELKAL